MPHDHHHDHNTGNEHRALIAAALTGSFMLVEVVAGFLTGSLALIADAAHMMADSGALILAWLAFRIARRPADARRTFGWGRFQVLAAFANGIALILLTLWIVGEAIGRIGAAPEIDGGPMGVVAVIGLVVNLVAFAVLHGGDRENLNMRGALLHVAGDILGSIAAIIAAVVILTTGWTPIDPILSVLIAMLLLKAASGLVIQSGRILLEATPDHVDRDAIAADLSEHTPGVVRIHHMHIWAIAPDRTVATLHAVLESGVCEQTAAAALRRRLAGHHGVGHVTIEVERDY
jgi:cobalt-zinc-cadmium efflux system protein